MYWFRARLYISWTCITIRMAKKWIYSIYANASSPPCVHALHHWDREDHSWSTQNNRTRIAGRSRALFIGAQTNRGLESGCVVKRTFIGHPILLVAAEGPLGFANIAISKPWVLLQYYMINFGKHEGGHLDMKPGEEWQRCAVLLVWTESTADTTQEWLGASRGSGCGHEASRQNAKAARLPKGKGAGDCIHYGQSSKRKMVLYSKGKLAKPQDHAPRAVGLCAKWFSASIAACQNQEWQQAPVEPADDRTVQCHFSERDTSQKTFAIASVQIATRAFPTRAESYFVNRHGSQPALMTATVWMANLVVSSCIRLMETWKWILLNPLPRAGQARVCLCSQDAVCLSQHS